MLELRGDDFHLTVGFDSRIGKGWIKGQGHARGNGPRGGRPDDGINILAFQLGGDFLRGRAILNKLVSHVDGRAAVILILHFRFRQRGRIVNAPVHRLAPAVDVAFLHKVQKSSGNRGFIVKAHGQIRIVPLAENSEPLEIALVLLHIARCEFAAQLAELRGRNFAFTAQFLFDLRLDGQAVAIPSGHVRRVVTGHAFCFYDQVFKDFVQAGAEMNFSSGIRRPIVQHEERLAFARFENTLVKVCPVPGCELFRLVLGQAGLHRKVGLGQVERLLEFEWFGHGLERRKSLLLPCFLPPRLLSVRPGTRRETSETSRTIYVTMNCR